MFILVSKQLEEDEDEYSALSENISMGVHNLSNILFIKYITLKCR
jgi:hypothetical protein